MSEQPLPSGRVGIFWGLIGIEGDLALLSQSSNLAEAEVYGDCLTFATSHFEAWEAWKSNVGSIPEPRFAELIVASEYENHPRGRVVFSVSDDKFWLYADRRLSTKAFTSQIAKAFDIEDGMFTVRLDSHYR